MIKQVLAVLLFSIATSFACNNSVFAQNTEIVNAVQEPFSPESLIRNYFIGDGVEIVNINYQGIPEATGYFSNGLSDLGIDQGIVLGTGKVDRFLNPHTNESSTLTSDQDIVNQELADIIGADLLKDVATYEITFIPSADSIQFNYVFASEEYPEYVCSQFNDVFGFFISGPNPNGGQYNSQNIAIVPGTNNLPVSINNVNSGTAGSSGDQANCASVANLDNTQFYNESTSQNLVFDGILDPFSAAAKVIPCETYTIKFSIGDVNDFLKDSAVFLEGKSFSSNALAITAVTTSANGTITEGCAEASLLFELPVPLSTDELITFEIIGSAENGVDYENIPTSINIPAGETTALITVLPLDDGIEENIESLGIIVTHSTCIVDTLWLGIEDNYLVPVQEQGPIFLCDNLPDEVDFTIPFTPPTPSVFRNQNSLRIEPTFEPVFSTIEVKDIYPSTLNQTDFIQVCIDDLTHPWIDDLSIFLYGPDNQFIELTSKNGGNGGNGTQPDFLINTCFTFDAVDLISDPSLTPPYIGTFQPEGDWESLFGSNTYQTNGNWRLMLRDDFQGSVGTLNSWSIHFGKSYNINYTWSPSQGISCTDCPNPTFNPTTDQTYTLDIEDSNGCELSYEVDVLANSSVTASPVLECNNVSMEEIIFSWADIPEATSYTISINGNPWENIGNNLNYSVNNLSPGSSVTFEIQAIGACSNSDIIQTTCSTGECQLEIDLESIGEPQCFNENNGFISVQASGGEEPYTYFFGDIQNSTGLFENIISGDYKFRAIDNANCVGEITLTLTGKDDILIEGTVDNIECGEVSGSINLAVSGGNGELALDWSENFTGDIGNLSAGTYDLVVTDEDGCTAENSFTVETVANFTALFEVINPLCKGDANGAIEVSLNDQSLTVDIDWSNGMTGSSINDLMAGLYTVVITNSDGCQLIKDFELEASAALEIELLKGDNSCFGDNQGFSTLQIEGGTEPYNVSWSNNQTGIQIDNLVAGTYSASISDMNGCETMQSITITEPEELEIENTIIELPSCEVQNGSISLFPQGGTAPYLIKQNDEDFVEETTFTNLTPGEYRYEIMDSNGCVFSTQQAFIIEEVEDIALVAEPIFQIELGESIALNAVVTNRANNVSYEWVGINSNDLSCIACQDPIFNGTSTSTYEVIATDEQGCIAVQNVTVQVDLNAEIYVPNAFSPNGDGINDKLAIFAKSNVVSSIDNFSLYDRWGTQVFRSLDIEVNNSNDGWNGQYKGEALNQGIFVWKLQVTFIDGRTENLSGDVSLLR